MGHSDSAPLLRTSGRPGAGRAGPPLLVVGAAYIALGLWAIQSYVQQMNPDGISHISIARKYWAGDLGAAINAYWSPFYSWLLAPFLGAGIVPGLATKVLALVLGLVLLLGVWQIARQLGLGLWTAALVCVALVPVTLDLGMTMITSDLLATTMVVLYLVVMTKPEGLVTRRDAIAAGLLGGLAYLAKSYMLGLFVVHYTAVMLWRLRVLQESRRRHLALAAASFATCGVIVAAWTSALSLKYDRFIMGSAGAYNHALHHPIERGHPHHIDGLQRPPNATAVSAWEDPTYTAIHGWSPFASTRNLLHQLRRMHENARSTIVALQWYSLLSIGIVFAALLFAGGRLEPGPGKPLLVLLLAVLIQPLGYLLFQVTARYLAPTAVGLCLIGAFLVSRSRWLPAGTLRSTAALVLLCASFAVEPAQSLWRQRGMGQLDHTRSVALQGVIPRGSRVASNTQWARTMRISLDQGLRYFGELQPGITAGAALDQLDRHGINYYIVWESGPEMPFTRAWDEVSNARLPEVRIYRVEEAEDSVVPNGETAGPSNRGER
jgi:hypothetical protein